MKPVIVTTGEPAGIGPDIAIKVAMLRPNIVLCGDWDVLSERARLLGLTPDFCEYQAGMSFMPGVIAVMPIKAKARVVPGQLNPNNSAYVIKHIEAAANAVYDKQFSALITAPVHKAVINHAGIPFSGHTELLADLFHIPQVVMMLACQRLKVALVTNHLALSSVPSAITKDKVMQVLSILKSSLQDLFSIAKPKIYVTGLNPHAGEDGVLGREEIDEISPAINSMQDDNILGPFPADTLFTPPFLEKADAFLAMYHDQGLTVLKALGFGQSVNITLGLPINRLSVDHGTALMLAGTGKASHQSLTFAIDCLKK